MPMQAGHASISIMLPPATPSKMCRFLPSSHFLPYYNNIHIHTQALKTFKKKSIQDGSPPHDAPQQ
jgi:hypothetical protein